MRLHVKGQRRRCWSRTLCQRDDGYPLPPLSKVRIAVEEPLQVGISYATQPLEVFVGDLLR